MSDQPPRPSCGLDEVQGKAVTKPSPASREGSGSHLVWGSESSQKCLQLYVCPWPLENTACLSLSRVNEGRPSALGAENTGAVGHSLSPMRPERRCYSLNVFLISPFVLEMCFHYEKIKSFLEI